MSDTTETPATEKTEAGTTETPKDVEAAKTSDAQPTTPSGTATTASDGSPANATANPPKKSAVDIDKLVEAAAKAQSDAAEKIKQADARAHELEQRAAKLKRYEEWDTGVSQADADAKLTAVKAIVRNMLADGYDPSAIIQAFAEDVELPPEQIDPAELPKKIPELINREVDKREKAREAREAAEKKAAEETAAAERKAEEDRKAAEDAQTRDEYIAELASDLKRMPEKFPLCNAWAHRITPEKVLAVAQAFANVNKKAPTADELFPAIETEFRAELEKATGFKPTAAAATPGTVTSSTNVDAEIEKELEEMDRKAKLQKKDPAAAAPTVEDDGEGDVMEKILKTLDRQDKSRDGRLQYD